MTDPIARDPSPGVALFDLDGTLTWHDTLGAFLAGYVRRHPARLPRLWRLAPAALEYLAAGRDRGRLKSRVIRAVLGGEPRERIDAWADRFVEGMRGAGMFRPAALAALESHRAAGDHLVLLSASPDLYVPRIGRLLGFELTLCTGVAWDAHTLDGRLTTPNRRGEEKSRCLQTLRGRFPGAAITAYGNSASDLPHLRLAERAVLVNGGGGARRSAAAAGIPTALWT